MQQRLGRCGCAGRQHQEQRPLFGAEQARAATVNEEGKQTSQPQRPVEQHAVHEPFPLPGEQQQHAQYLSVKQRHRQGPIEARLVQAQESDRQQELAHQQVLGAQPRRGGAQPPGQPKHAARGQGCPPDQPGYGWVSQAE
ncbi:hypothetical protein [Hymenobacter radiodurans]|uniref:hypothetical protein n=1 Tax=Hymenobacter radiodurans TaxID=2496028 RepID=UPI001058CFB3|nr:hypothetical protein [Hymenobacter radiodurans]